MTNLGVVFAQSSRKQLLLLKSCLTNQCFQILRIVQQQKKSPNPELPSWYCITKNGTAHLPKAGSVESVKFRNSNHLSCWQTRCTIFQFYETRRKKVFSHPCTHTLILCDHSEVLILSYSFLPYFSSIPIIQRLPSVLNPLLYMHRVVPLVMLLYLWLL